MTQVLCLSIYFLFGVWVGTRLKVRCDNKNPPKQPTQVLLRVALGKEVDWATTQILTMRKFAAIEATYNEKWMISDRGWFEVQIKPTLPPEGAVSAGQEEE